MMSSMMMAQKMERMLTVRANDQRPRTSHGNALGLVSTGSRCLDSLFPRMVETVSRPLSSSGARYLATIVLKVTEFACSFGC